MLGVRGGPERQREQEAAAQAHLKERGTVSRRGMDPESFTYEEKESYVRFAPFMGMRSCALEPRSEMQGHQPLKRPQVAIPRSGLGTSRVVHCVPDTM